MKTVKFRITDEDGQDYLVEEVSDEKEMSKSPINEKDENTEDILSDYEIASLKKLASHADELLKLLKVEEKEHEATEDEDLEKEDEDIEEVLKEDIVDTEEETKKDMSDSKASFGSIAKKSTKDSNIDYNLEIENAWSKRYGGK